MKPHDIVKCLEKHGINVLFAAIFGSYGTEDWSPSSDIDIFIVIEPSGKGIKLNMDKSLPQNAYIWLFYGIK